MFYGIRPSGRRKKGCSSQLDNRKLKGTYLIRPFLMMWPGTSVGEDLYRRVVFNRGPYDKVAKLFFGNGYIMGALTTTLNRRYK